MDISMEGEPICYSPSKVEDKHFFGGFFNLAWNNIEGVMDEFATRYRTKTKTKPVDDTLSYYTAIIKECFAENISHSDWEKRTFYLKQFFPVIHFLDLPLTHDKFKRAKADQKNTEKRKLFVKNLLELITLISHLRNLYTHYEHDEIENKLYCYQLLDRIFLDVCKNVRSKRMKTDKTKQLLKDSLKGKFEELINNKREKLLKKKAEGGRVDLAKDKIESSVFNDAFKHLINKELPTEEVKNPLEKVGDDYLAKWPHVIPADNKVNLSDYSVLFLLSMFLLKKENEDIRAKVRGFKGKNQLKMMATHWVYSYLSFKGSRHRLGNTYNDETLLVQIIDELSKVPDEVYRNLSVESKEQFLEDINEYAKEGKEDYTVDESTVVHPVIRKRYQDNFNYYALRYLDEKVEFPTLKLQVNLGSYVHDVRPKEIDGTTFIVDRKVKEQFRVFGKLSEVSKLKTDFFIDAQQKEVLDELQWEQYPNPSYNFDTEKDEQHNIPIYIDMSKSNVPGAKEIGEQHILDQKKIEKIKRGEKALGAEKKEEREKIIRNSFKGLLKNVKFCKPTALLSLNELPALLYEVIINKKTGAEIEEMIIRKIVEQQQRLNDYTQGDKSSSVPKNFTKASTEEQIDVKKLLSAIKEDLRVNEEKIKLIDRKEKELKEEKNKNHGIKRTCAFKNFELGQEATWLANDIKRFMPKEVLLQWRGRHHTNLQKALAYYDFSKEEARACITCFWNIDEKDYFSVGIYNAFQSNTFVEFYKTYLAHRKEIYEGFFHSVESTKDGPKKMQNRALKDVFYIYKRNSFTIQSLSKQKERLKSALFVLPRGIFDDKPTYVKDKNLKDNPEVFADWYRYANNPEIEFQSFYDLPRDYTDYFNEQQEERRKRYLRKEEIHRKEKDIEEVKRIYSQQEDMIIKKVKMNDVFMKLIADSLFKMVLKTDLDKSLKDIYLTQEERAKSYAEAFGQSKREQGNSSRNIFNESFLWRSTVSFNKGQLKEDEIIIKNIGKYNNLIADEKVKALFSYDSKKIWTKKELEDELRISNTSYEVIRREQAFKEIQQFEKFLLKHHTQEAFVKDNPNAEAFKELSKDKPNFRTWMELGVETRFALSPRKEEIETKVDLLVELRNKFSHNQLPTKSLFDKMNALYLFESVKDKYSADEVFTYSTYFQFVIENICKELKALYSHS